MASSTTSTPGVSDSGVKPIRGRLFFLDVGGGRVFSSNPDGSDLKVIVS